VKSTACEISLRAHLLCYDSRPCPAGSGSGSDYPLVSFVHAEAYSWKIWRSGSTRGAGLTATGVGRGALRHVGQRYAGLPVHLQLADRVARRWAIRNNDLVHRWHTYATSKGLLLKESPQATKAAFARHGLAAPSTYRNYDHLGDKWPQVLEDCNLIGHKYVVTSWIEDRVRDQPDGFKRAAEDFNRAGETSKKVGNLLEHGWRHSHIFVRTTHVSRPILSVPLFAVFPNDRYPFIDYVDDRATWGGPL
jgi:hypothetical protein